MPTPNRRKSGKGKVFKTGRVCKKTGCKQKLSIYNPDDYCHVHQQELLR